MCSEHALSLIENYIAKRQRSCVAQSVEQSPGLREVLGSNPGTADQCFSAIFLSYNNIVLFYITISEATYTTCLIIHINNICVFHINLII